ncbi:MAG: flagellar basal body rod protein FlgB [Alphaproteobacteria bacterium]|nr:flagellar basal body rod protein FlgB [Alphaproteobacteria bacterium]
MNPTSAPLFKLLSARMGWLGQRQGILAQNIANADTPDYRPRDLREKDFQKLVQGVAGRPSRLAIARTAESHMLGMASATIGLTGEKQHAPYETSPDGNAVILEEQTAKAGKTALDHQLASNIYKKYVGMIKIALGSTGG